jgi:phage replication O-like protein O
MANPALKNGYFSIANELAEQFGRVNITGQEWRIIWVLLRMTWGWKKGGKRKDWDWISITQFEQKTGMKRSNVFKTIRSLLAKRLILKQENQLKFNQNYNEWVLAKRLIVLANSIQGISQKTNKTVSQLATHKRKKENIQKKVVIKEKLSTIQLNSGFEPISKIIKRKYGKSN